MERDRFVFYREYEAILARLPMEFRYNAIRAIIRYELHGDEPYGKEDWLGQLVVEIVKMIHDLKETRMESEIE